MNKLETITDKLTEQSDIKLKAEINELIKPIGFELRHCNDFVFKKTPNDYGVTITDNKVTIRINRLINLIENHIFEKKRDKAREDTINDFMRTIEQKCLLGFFE